MKRFALALALSLLPVAAHAQICTKAPAICDNNYVASPSTIIIRGANPAVACAAQTITVTVNDVVTVITYGTGWCASGGATCVSNKPNACVSLASQIAPLGNIKNAHCSGSTVSITPDANKVSYFNLATSAAACAAVSNPSSNGSVLIGQTKFVDGGNGVLAFTRRNGTTGAALTAGTLVLSGELSVAGSTMTTGIHTGTNGGTWGNETNNVWTMAEASEDWLATFSTGANTVTFSSTTGLTPVFTPAVAISGDLTLNGGAGALRFGAASSSVLTTDNSATGLLVGSSGMPNLMTLVTSTGTEKVMINGTTTQTALHLDVGTFLFDESGTVTGDLSLGGGAGALTFTAASSSVVVPNNSATALVLGGSGLANLLTVDTQTNAQKLMITGTTTATALHVDVGTTLLDEKLTLGGGAGALTLTGASGSILLKDATAVSLDIGSAGRTALMSFDTTDNAEKVTLSGYAATTVLSVPVGESVFVEGVGAPILATTYDKVRFCGNGANATTPNYMKPLLEDSYATDMTYGATACDSNDSTTIGTADLAWTAYAYKPVGMICVITGVGAGNNDVVTFQLYDDTAAISGMSCTVTMAGTAVKQCSVSDRSPATVAAASHITVGSVAATDDDLSTADAECTVFVNY